MQNLKKRIGIIGYGLIGSYVYREIVENPSMNLEIAFVHDLDGSRTAVLPREAVLERVEDFPMRKPDMIVELAHSDVTRKYGAFFLTKTDYFLLSVTALADENLEKKLKATAERVGTRLFVPHGGVMGLDALIDGAKMWQEVKIVMKKNPRNLDFARSGIDPATIAAETLLYDGPTRGICMKFPRNVNTHATVAIAGLGFDRTHSTLYADPNLNAAVMEVHAKGGGVDLTMKRSEEITGVSGASTPWSVLRSILSTASRNPGMHFC